MKKFFISFMVLLTFVMQSFTILPGQTQVLLRVKEPKLTGGMQGPSKSPETNIESVISVYLNESSDSLLFYTKSEETVTYYIYDAAEQEVSNGCVAFSDQGESSVYIGTLDEGTYTISIEVDSLVYEGEFDIY